ncbi:MAG: DNA cytosine methyltransferase [Alkalilacustris sp.]
MNHMMRPSVELFAGAGGLGIGLSQAGFEPVEVVEFNRWCCDTLRENHDTLARREGTWRIFEGDVRQVDFRRLEGKVDLVSGGPPCQPFSLGGKHRAFNDQRDMFPQAVRAVREARPKAFVFENVKGLTRAAFRNYLQYVHLQMEHPEVVERADEDWTEHLSRLEQHHTSGRREGLNYQVVVQLLNAADYGVPQRRDRVVFVGFRDDVGARWSFPRPDHSQAALVWDQAFGDYWDRNRVPKKQRVMEGRANRAAERMSRDERPEEKPWRTVREALAGLPDPRKASGKIPNHFFQDGARSYPGHTGSFIDEPAKALKAGVHGVPGGENMMRLADGSIRYFTVRESARLQTFPDAYRFHGAWSECMRQLGNAVPVELARRVGESVVEHLNQG